MTPSKKLQTGIASVALVVLAATGAAVAANELTGGKTPQALTAGSFVAANSNSRAGTTHFGHGGPGFHHDDLAAAATYLGISESALRGQLESGKTLAQVANATSGKSAAGLIDALVAAEKAELAAAVKAGALTQAQADQLAANLEAHETAEVNGTFQGHGHGPGGPGFRHDGLAAAATYLGISESALRTQLEAGKTLAQVANATSGKSAAGLIGALVAAAKTELTAAVKAGTLTQAQADQMSADLKAHVTAAVNGTFRGHGGPRGHHGHGESLAAAASYLGITPTALMTQLRSGKTLAQIAEATSGKSTAGLVTALVAAEKTELAAAVKAGRLTQAQADQIESGLQARVTAMVDGRRLTHGEPRRHSGGMSAFSPAGAQI